MTRKMTLSPEQAADAVRKYTSGMTAQQICLDIGVHSRIVQRHLVENGVYEYGRKFTGRISGEQKQEMCTLYVEGWSQGALAKRYGYSRANIRLLLTRRGVALRNERVFPLTAEMADKIRDRRSLGWNFTKIARDLDVPPHRVLSWARKMGISDYQAKRGADNPAWRGGRIEQAGGYWYTQVSPQDPLFVMAHTNGYAPEHRIVMARSIGRPLLRSETVHHINGDKADNRIENLQLRKGLHGNGVVYACADCGSHNVVPVPIAT